ncbi:hypothetical protein M9458_037968, partial [Cirrhinus mrigala]
SKPPLPNLAWNCVSSPQMWTQRWSAGTSRTTRWFDYVRSYPAWRIPCTSSP